MKQKTLWRGVFTYARFVEEPIYRAAHTKRQAWLVMCNYLAKKHGVCRSYVYNLFDGSQANFEIDKEIIWEEDKTTQE